MTKLQPSDILDNARYEEQRSELRRRVMAIKAQRRVHLGDHLTFLFENADTMRYQVQEMLRAEGRSSPEDVAHELATYNELIGAPGTLCCTLLIEIEGEELRARKLREWLDLPRHLFLELEDGSRAPAQYDERQVGEDRLSSVQYLEFACPSPPVAVACDHPQLELRTELTPVQRGALEEDLAS